MYGQGWPGQGSCRALPLACGASVQNWSLPAGIPPRLLPKASLQAHSPAACCFLPEGGPLSLHSAHSASGPREKSTSGWSSLRAFTPECWCQLGGPHTQAKAEPHAHVCSCPLHLQRAWVSQSLSGSSLAPPAAQPLWEGAVMT